MPVIARQMKRLLIVAICVAWIVPWAMLAKGQEEEDLPIPDAYIDLVEHSGEVFIGTIDIVTGAYMLDRDGEGPGINTEYTVLVSEMLKGKLEPQSIIVVQQDGGTLSGVAEYYEGDGPLIPGNEYLFFARRSAGTPVYRITEPVVGNLPITSDDERARLIAYWSKIVERTACLQTDVIMLDDVIYARRDWNDEKRYLEREWVGATIATILFQDTSATGCRDDLGPEVASELPVRTKVQSLDGYDPSFRVAVRKRDGHRYLYEAIRSETAESGADLLDFEGRVVSVTYERNPLPECDDIGESMCDLPAYPSIEDVATIDQLLTILTSAPVDPDRTNWRNLPPERLHLVFTLDDGSTFELVISLRTGLTPSGIVVPVDDLMDVLGID